MKSAELKRLRKDAGLTMADASRLFQTPYRTWQNWENGSRRVPPMAGVILELYKKVKESDKRIYIRPGLPKAALKKLREGLTEES